jgi:hypothetical protein
MAAENKGLRYGVISLMVKCRRVLIKRDRMRKRAGEMGAWEAVEVRCSVSPEKVASAMGKDRLFRVFLGLEGVVSHAGQSAPWACK